MNKKGGLKKIDDQGGEGGWVRGLARLGRSAWPHINKGCFVRLLLDRRMNALRVPAAARTKLKNFYQAPPVNQFKNFVTTPKKFLHHSLTQFEPHRHRQRTARALFIRRWFRIRFARCAHVFRSA